MHSLLGLQQIRERRGEQKLVCSKNKVILFSQPQERGHISEDIKPLLYICAVGGGGEKKPSEPVAVKRLFPSTQERLWRGGETVEGVFQFGRRPENGWS